MVFDDRLAVDMVLVNGKVVTVDVNDSIVEAVAIKGDRIQATSSSSYCT